MMRIPSASSRIQIGMIWPPQRANTRLTPRCFSRRAMRLAALSGETFILRLLSCYLIKQIGEAPGLRVRGVQESHATSSETVKTANTCEARIEPDVTPASSPYSFALVNGPDSVGSALKITAECDHSGGIVKT